MTWGDRAQLAFASSLYVGGLCESQLRRQAPRGRRGDTWRASEKKAQGKGYRTSRDVVCGALLCAFSRPFYVCAYTVRTSHLSHPYHEARIPYQHPGVARASTTPCGERRVRRRSRVAIFARYKRLSSCKASVHVDCLVAAWFVQVKDFVFAQKRTHVRVHVYEPDVNGAPEQLQSIGHVYEPDVNGQAYLFPYAHTRARRMPPVPLAVSLTLCTARPSSQCRRKARRLEPGPPTTQDLGKSRKVTWTASSAPRRR